MQAIITKYIPCTNTKPSRVKATCEAGSITLSWDSSGDDKLVHQGAARKLCQKLGWKGEMITGGTKAFYCHVRTKYGKEECKAERFAV